MLYEVITGLSTIVTASAQGAVAWYGTYVVGRAESLNVGIAGAVLMGHIAGQIYQKGI